jgi:acetoin utilization deacetylase AcuC-like enzyme
VLFVSIHESPLYPGSGPASDTGGGPGEGTTLNLPVTGGSGDALWCSLVEHVVVPRAREHAPQLVLISAGYDAHREDPLATCRVTEPGFATMAASLARLAAEVEAPLGVVLEGGYAVEALARSVAVTLEVIGAGEPPPAPDLPVHPALRSLV